MFFLKTTILGVQRSSIFVSYLSVKDFSFQQGFHKLLLYSFFDCLHGSKKPKGCFLKMKQQKPKHYSGRRSLVYFSFLKYFVAFGNLPPFWQAYTSMCVRENQNKLQLLSFKIFSAISQLTIIFQTDNDEKNADIKTLVVAERAGLSIISSKDCICVRKMFGSRPKSGVHPTDYLVL